LPALSRPKARRSWALFLATLLNGCGDRPDVIEAVGGNRYRVPAAEVVGHIPASQGLYLNLHPPGRRFVLVQSHTDTYATNYAGKGTPIVSHINDVIDRNFEIHRFPEGPTVCRPSKPAFACGLRLQDGKAEWTVMFEQADVQDSSVLRAEALHQLAAYRAAARASRP
jgi:hypothetical protein